MKKVFLALFYLACLMKVQLAFAMDPPSSLVNILVPRELVEHISAQSLAARLGMTQSAAATLALSQAKNIDLKKVVQFKYTAGGDEVVEVEELDRELGANMNKMKDLVRSIIYFEHQPEHAAHRYLYDFLAKNNGYPYYLYLELYICDNDKLLDSNNNFATCRAFFFDKEADDEMQSISSLNALFGIQPFITPA